MAVERTSTERLVAFTDAVFAVIITIMVLELKPPAEAKLSALLPLWPTGLSYAVSYLFVAISVVIVTGASQGIDRKRSPTCPHSWYRLQRNG